MKMMWQYSGKVCDDNPKKFTYESGKLTAGHKCKIRQAILMIAFSIE